ncbi:MAG: 6-carboxytetrahydropterin synthase [Bacteroidales bacterium]|nr:6-carboxytetrahydropterin synthase [Bacteroidales bacterium]
MSQIRLTKEFRFEMAHVLDGYDGLCSNMHGHSYILSVTVIGLPIQQKGHPKLGMVMDFGDLKRIVNPLIVSRFDHAVSVMENTPMHKRLVDAQFARVEVLPFQPTCENMLEYFAEIISAQLPAGVSLHHLKMHETATSYAEWYASDNS